VCISFCLVHVCFISLHASRSIVASQGCRTTLI
jgi:hypothetical protein